MIYYVPWNNQIYFDIEYIIKIIKNQSLNAPMLNMCVVSLNEQKKCFRLSNVYGKWTVVSLFILLNVLIHEVVAALVWFWFFTWETRKWSWKIIAEFEQNWQKNAMCFTLQLVAKIRQFHWLDYLYIECYTSVYIIHKELQSSKLYSKNLSIV